MFKLEFAFWQPSVTNALVSDIRQSVMHDSVVEISHLNGFRVTFDDGSVGMALYDLALFVKMKFKEHRKAIKYITFRAKGEVLNNGFEFSSLYLPVQDDHEGEKQELARFRSDVKDCCSWLMVEIHEHDYFDYIVEVFEQRVKRLRSATLIDDAIAKGWQDFEDRNFRRARRCLQEARELVSSSASKIARE